MRKTGYFLMLFMGLFLACFATTVSGASASSANISHAYHSTSPLANGAIVGLDPKKADYVVAADTDDGSRLVGVVVAKNDSILAVDEAGSTVQVATSGNVTTLVSNLNGDIDVGDQIAVSPFSGLGMKALPGSHVIGLAQTSFDSKTPDSVTKEVKNKRGKTEKIKVGYIQLTIAVGTGNISSVDTGPSVLQKFAKSLTGRTIPTFRIVASMVVALIGFVVLVTLIYGAIYGSIISVGRNPLAKYSIFRTLSMVLGMAVLTAAVVAGTIFFLLR